MAYLSDLTDSAAVEDAIDEFRMVGREAFLERYGFRKSQDYFVIADGERIDSKPVVAAAYGRQFPERGPLKARQFSGGASGAARTLRRLGFTVATVAEVRPPVVGEEHPSRTDVYDFYGGDKVGGVVTLPGDSTVNVFSDADGPYEDDPPTITEPFGYRGQGLEGPQKLSQRGNALLESARVAQEAVRFWHRPSGGSFTFRTWCVVLGRTWVHDQQRAQLQWMLQAVPGPERGDWPDALQLALDEAAALAEDEVIGPEAKPDPTYAELVDRVESRGQGRTRLGAPRLDYPRSAAARRAVLVRSGGSCESPRCTGMPAERNRSDEPILDVDHIKDLARGGDDHPRNMIALCPNCHACKTRGDTRRWRAELAVVAAAANERALHTASEA
ncbi:HNH endonuclease [Cellulomonas triticagri]|uniref:HNH endonuclease n=1 Tax=Cellulomonas triticagri TaxID=2483352 RepID=A0A3M2JMQ5_9CELL|nr:HNH endonuclease signature motif containing protein [Cellulomonas triticagri]RMI13556.1 HNH endonuclease [Cellulomonas triticagri]